MFPVLFCRAHSHVSCCDYPLPVLVFPLPFFCVHLCFICSLVPVCLNLFVSSFLCQFVYFAPGVTVSAPCVCCCWSPTTSAWFVLLFRILDLPQPVCSFLLPAFNFSDYSLSIKLAFFVFSTHRPLCVLCLGPFSISATVIERIPGLLCKYAIDILEWKRPSCHPTDITISHSIPESLERCLRFAALVLSLYACSWNLQHFQGQSTTVP